jgi:hypothetical protein
MCMSHTTHITGKVLLLAQDSLIPVELIFKELDELFEALLIRCLAAVGLEQLFVGNAARIRVELRILDACRLLEFREGLGLAGDQLGAGPLRRKVAADST